jgi:hypothetical protein
MGHRDTVAALIFLGGGLHFKAVEGESLLAYSDGGELRPDIPIEAVLVHAEVAGGIAKPDESRQDVCGVRRVGPLPACLCGRTRHCVDVVDG